MLGDIFRIQGMRTASLETAPTAQNLKNASIYVIVDADTKKETTDPHLHTPAGYQSHHRLGEGRVEYCS